MAQGDIYQLRLNYHDVHLEPMLNVFYYQQVDVGSPSASDLRSSWVTTVLSKIKDMWPANTVVDSVATINGMNNSDFDTDYTNHVGVNPSTAYLPSFIAMAMRNPSPGPGQQYAYKRFGGMTAQLESPTGRWDPTILGKANDVADVLDSTLAPGGISLTPCIIKGGFILGTNPTFARYVDTNWQVNEVPTSQNTRKQYLWN